VVPAAVRGADIVILATRSERPVIDADWIDSGTHVNTVGPKTLSAHEDAHSVDRNCGDCRE
jgi:ornithine cyclodeaminase/alanine dehydrogenase-like protein (mu-crystallin family)